MQNGETTSAPLFDTIGHGAEQIDNLARGDEEGQKLVEEIESMCINCEENVSPQPTPDRTDSKGTTRLLLTKIPFFREVVLMSFSCPHCGNSLFVLWVLSGRLLQLGNSKCWTNSTAGIEICIQTHYTRRLEQKNHKI